MLHFAGVHKVKFSDWTAEVLESRKIVLPPLAAVMARCSLPSSSTVAEPLGSRGNAVGVEVTKEASCAETNR
jgi:hypothetical protein